MKWAVSLVTAGALILGGCSRDSASGKNAAAPQPAPPDAKALYLQHCATCHMDDGSGVPFMQPSLRDSAVVAGDESLLIQVILRGPANVLPANRERYGNPMADFSALSDPEIAAVLNYVRSQFAGRESWITPASVAAVRREP